MKSHEEIASRVFSRRDAYKKEQKKQMRRILPAAVSACLVLAILLSLWLYPPIPPHTVDPNETTTDGSGRVLWQDTRPKSGKNSIMENGYYEFPWAYKTNAERYTSLSLGDVKYASRYSEINASHIGEELGVGEAVGYDIYKDKMHFASPSVYALKGISPNLIVAAKYDDGYCLYRSDAEFAFPTLGDLIDAYDLTATLPLTGYYDYTSIIYTLQYRALNEGENSKIWEMLEDCRSAKSATYDQNSKAKYIAFSATSEVLGIENRSFRISADGYLWTNLADYANAYFIGESAAKEIMEYVKASSTKQSPPTFSYLTGTIVETGDGYLKLDDSIMMKNASDGLIFSVLLKDFSIRRYVDSGYLEVGDTITVKYDGRIYDGDALTIETAYEIHHAIVTNDGNALIPE